MSTDPDIISNSYLAALAGAIVGLKAIPGASYWERLMNLVTGFLVAIYAGPAVVDYLHIASTRIAAGLVFAMGAGGLVVFAALVDGIKQTPLADIIAGYLRKRGT